MVRPAVANSLAPNRSDSAPATGPTSRNPTVSGTIEMPAHSGVSAKLFPCCGSQIPCSQMISMNWIPPRPRAPSIPAMLPAVNARTLNRLSRNIGAGTLVSTQQNTTRMAIPPKMPASTQGLVQPVGWPPYGSSEYTIPTSTEISPTANRVLPSQSILAGMRTPLSRSMR